MRNAFLALLFLLGASVSAQKNDLTTFFTQVDRFLNDVVSEGKVDYSAIKSASEDLEKIVQLVAEQSLEGNTEQEKKAFYINAYNLLVIHSIVQEYPVGSPKSIVGFFDSPRHTVAGERLSVNQIENERLDPAKDPRLHFVLVCAAVSCPVIEPFAYLPSKLEEQLVTQTKKALNDEQFIRLNSTKQEVQLSKIFSWYKADFTKGITLQDYVNAYRKNAIPDAYSIRFYEYDWTLNDNSSFNHIDDRAGVEQSNLQTFTPSALFNQGQYEVNFFNSIYSQQAVRDADGNTVNVPGTQSFFNSMIQYTTGINQAGRINVGLDVNIVKAKYSRNKESGVAVLSSNGAVYQKTVISSIAPRIKLSPFRSIPRFSIQSSLLIPIAQDQQSAGPNSTYFIAHDRYTWFTQFFFDQSYGENFQLFLEADLLYRFDYNNANEQDFFRVPLSAFISYFPTSESTIYLFSQYSPRFEKVSNTVEGEELGLTQWFTQVGVGGKYQLTSRIGLELSYANFALSRNDGAGYNLNFGLRYIYR